MGGESAESKVNKRKNTPKHLTKAIKDSKLNIL
jgi:hypothetical protein